VDLVGNYADGERVERIVVGLHHQCSLRLKLVERILERESGGRVYNIFRPRLDLSHEKRFKINYVTLREVH